MPLKIVNFKVIKTTLPFILGAFFYILNEYNALRKRFPRLSPLRAYVKAWNIKIIPIFLTVTSTILGFIPFMAGAEKEGFWFPLAAGTIGGLIMSVVGVFIFLPVLTLKKKNFVELKGEPMRQRKKK